MHSACSKVQPNAARGFRVATDIITLHHSASGRFVYVTPNADLGEDEVVKVRPEALCAATGLQAMAAMPVVIFLISQALGFGNGVFTTVKLKKRPAKGPLEDASKQVESWAAGERNRA